MMIGGNFTTLAAYIYQQISNFDVRASSAMAVVLLCIAWRCSSSKNTGWSARA